MSPDEEALTKEEAAAMGGKADGVDLCETWEWYDDGICDAFCTNPDPDCEDDGQAPCCGLDELPGCFEGAFCCADGSWQCGNGPGQPAPCEQEGLVCEPQPAPCCEPDDAPPCFEGAFCCADGQWACGNGPDEPSPCDQDGEVCAAAD
jgi:hypothetical protein